MSNNQFQHKGSVHFFQKKPDPKPDYSGAITLIIIVLVVLGVMVG